MPVFIIKNIAVPSTRIGYLYPGLNVTVGQLAGKCPESNRRYLIEAFNTLLEFETKLYTVLRDV